MRHPCPVRNGRIVLLNGPSSAGKTSIAQALAVRMPTPWLVMPVDLFHSIRSRPPQRLLSQDEWDSVFRRTRSAYHRALAGAAAAGCDVVGDHVLSERWRLTELLELTHEIDVLLVHITCDLEELERREQQRGDREIGTARNQAREVFTHDDCDLEVDTSNMLPEACAARIAQLIAAPPAQTAFERLRHGGR
ncbi:AAA family ATPase [Nocardioides sp.]|uniref:chloramphenicol phosphotransferase CPT family protein n=1 Tax=Nocardioides sp. TaxID=35761 RepID=UPI0032193A79